MFEDITVVPSAVSAFNNAALAAPAFLWNALLCLPIFIVAGLLGRSFLGGLGISKYLTEKNVSFWTVIMVAIWVVLMGGNYDVLRDGVSLLPYVTAVILFLACAFVGCETRKVALPLWYGDVAVSKRKKWLVNIFVAVLVLVPVGLSDTLNWWGPILQIFAVLGGLYTGRRWVKREAPVSVLMMVMMLLVIAMMMQPEYFRFGQLGNLTPFHLLWVLGTGICFASFVALRFVNSRSRIHQSAFVKIKWLLRLLVVLCAVLFALTESVPFLLATLGFAFVSFALSVWHNASVDAALGQKAFAWSIIMFGVLISVPTITVLGVLYSVVFGKSARLSDMKFLL